jgi:hypothetical protein
MRFDRVNPYRRSSLWDGIRWVFAENAEKPNSSVNWCDSTRKERSKVSDYFWNNLHLFIAWLPGIVKVCSRWRRVTDDIVGRSVSKKVESDERFFQCSAMLRHERVKQQ